MAGERQKSWLEGSEATKLKEDQLLGRLKGRGDRPNGGKEKTNEMNRNGGDKGCAKSAGRLTGNRCPNEAKTGNAASEEGCSDKHKKKKNKKKVLLGVKKAAARANTQLEQGGTKWREREVWSFSRGRGWSWGWRVGGLRGGRQAAVQFTSV